MFSYTGSKIFFYICVNRASAIRQNAISDYSILFPIWNLVSTVFCNMYGALR